MAPEQVEGREADARTDIFALGVVLYEMIMAKPRFHGDSRASLAAAILTSTPRRSRHAQARSRPILDRVVQKCLAKNPRAALAERTRRGAGARMGRGRRRPRSQRVAGSGQSSAGAQLPLPSRRLPPRSDWLPSSCGRADGRRPYFRRPARPGCSTRPPIGEAPSRRPVSPLMDEFRLQRQLGKRTVAGLPGAFAEARCARSRCRRRKDSFDLTSWRYGRAHRRTEHRSVFGTPTLARVPLAGGAHRPMETGIIDADWIPGTETLAAGGTLAVAGSGGWSSPWERSSMRHARPGRFEYHPTGPVWRSSTGDSFSTNTGIDDHRG